MSLTGYGGIREYSGSSPIAGAAPGADAVVMSTDAPITTGTPPGAGAAVPSLRRCRAHRMVAGVAAGLGEHFDVDPLLVRAALLVLALAGGMGVPLYLALWLLVPADDSPTSIAEDLLDRYLPETLR